MIFANGNVYLEDHFEICDVRISNGKIVEIGKNLLGDDTVDISGKKLLPGLTDMHFHGCMGYDTCDGTMEAIENIAKYEASHGITQIVPTTMTYPEEKLRDAFISARDYDNRYAKLVGLHMEGPYISIEKIGAQNPKYLMKPDIGMTRRLNELSGGLLKVVSIAPEKEGAMEYGRELGEELIISVAHTASDYDTAKEAFENGFTHVTHLFNAMEPIHHRRPGVIVAASESDVTVEIITDGVHLHPSIVRLVYRLFDPKNVILVSDSMRATGLKDGVYDLGGQEVRVRGNRANLVEGGAIAGSATNLFDCMRTCIDMGVREEMAIYSATTAPAKALSIDGEVGIIKDKRLANLIILNDDYELLDVYIKGEKLC